MATQSFFFEAVYNFAVSCHKNQMKSSSQNFCFWYGIFSLRFIKAQCKLVEMCDEDNAGTTTIRAPCPSGIPFSSLSGSRSDQWWGVLGWGWLWLGWGWYHGCPRAHSLRVDEDSYHDVWWMAWTIQYISQVPRFFLISLQAPDCYFHKTFRSVQFYDYLVSILARNPLFYSPHKSQRPIKYQLAGFLIWYGQRTSDTLDVAAKLSIGHGSVHNYCRRVCWALWELWPEYLAWMMDLRKDIMAWVIEAKSGFPKCVGSGDGCQIRIGEAPQIDGKQFHSRKKNISVSNLFSYIEYWWILLKTNIQATVDHEARFTLYDLGWPSAVTDVKIFKNSDLWMHHRNYFRNTFSLIKVLFIL